MDRAKEKTLWSLLGTLILFYCCAGNGDKQPTTTKTDSTPKQVNNTDIVKKSTSLINPSGKTLAERFLVPEGYERVKVADNSFGAFLRKLPLKPNGSVVHLYDGTVKGDTVYEAVIDYDIGNQDLEQCADAVIRLRAEYLYSIKEYDKIAFHFTNGFLADYQHWMDGYRIAVKGNNVSWVKSSQPIDNYKSFRQYLNVVFSYAGTLSLSKELVSKSMKDIAPGDVIIRGGSPGHAVTVLDVAINKDGQKIFMIAQSYMPAQDIHVLKNRNTPEMSPWYVDNNADLFTPEYAFTNNELKCFKE